MVEMAFRGLKRLSVPWAVVDQWIDTMKVKMAFIVQWIAVTLGKTLAENRKRNLKTMLACWRKENPFEMNTSLGLVHRRFPIMFIILEVIFALFKSLK